MKKKNKMLIVLLWMCLSVFVFVGCKSTEEETQSVKEDDYTIMEDVEPVHAVLIVQAVETVPVVNIEAAEELLKDVCLIPDSTVSIIVADGKPWTYADITPEEIDPSFDMVMQEQILNQRMQLRT